MNLISLKTELRQELKLTPQLLQSMEVLQMNSQELLDYLGKISEENPTLELSEASELRSAYAELRQKASWLDAGTFGTSFAHEEDAPPEPGATDKELDSLSAFLCDQLERKRLPKPMLALCKYMAELVDEDGYLTQEDLDGLTEMKIPQTMVDQALDTIQSLEPAGVGARDLSECLIAERMAGILILEAKQHPLLHRLTGQSLLSHRPTEKVSQRIDSLTALQVFIPHGPGNGGGVQIQCLRQGGQLHG